jgi:hypothetical protein
MLLGEGFRLLNALEEVAHALRDRPYPLIKPALLRIRSPGGADRPEISH